MSDDKISMGRQIHDLLHELVIELVGTTDNHLDILRSATGYLAQCPKAMSTVLPLEESTIVSKVFKYFRHPSNEYSSDPSRPEQLFMKLFNELHNTTVEPEQRRKVLNFLYCMLNSKYDDIKPVKKTLIRSSSSTENRMEGGTSQSTSSLDRNYHNQPSIGPTNGDDSNNNGISSKNGGGVDMYMEMHRRNRGYVIAKSKTASYDPYLTNEAAPSISIQSVPNYLAMLKNEDNELNSDLVQNLIYAFSGIQGKYLKKDIITGRFKLDTAAKSLNDVQCGMMVRLAELGYYHDCVVSFTDYMSGLTALGQMGQGFVTAIRTELTKYYGLIAMLQDQLCSQRIEAEQAASQGDSLSTVNSQKLTLLKLLVWYTEPLNRLQWLTKIADAAKVKKGGELASIIYGFLGNGCPVVKAMTRELLIATCGPFLRMISHWLLVGDISDVNGEFFVECLADVGVQHLWHDKYRVRHKMLPAFISLELANKILVTGKSINFLREVCHDNRGVKGGEELKKCLRTNPDHLFAYVTDTTVHAAIETIYQNTAKRVLDIMVGPHKLLDHLQAMRRYLLLGQGDFIGILMENMKSELDKPATEIYSHDLSSIMDAALRCSNAQYDDQEIVNHLDVRVMNAFGGEVGWDIISLQYTVRGPLATMLEPSMNVYQVLFKPLWRMKHMEFVLSSKIWKDQKCNAKVLRSMSQELSKVSYRLHLLTSEMMHFVHQMQYYILFEVIECNWVEFQNHITQSKALDDMLEAHTKFLESIKRGSFLDQNSGAINGYLESVYDNILRLEIWQQKFYNLCFDELDCRKNYRKRIDASEAAGKFGINSEEQLQRDQEFKIFEQMLQSQEGSLVVIGQNYEKAVRGFLLALNSNDDPNLQLFGIRLDFNEYYKKRDTRLNVPLTFEHMRMSSTFLNASKTLIGSRYSTVN